VSEHKVTYRRGKDGWWRASVRGFKCRSRARTLRKARVMLRIALAPLVEDAYSIDFVEDVKLPGPARRLLKRHWAARRKAREAARRAREAAREAAAALRAQKVNQHDVADLLGLSLARLQQVLDAGRDA
jgi:uncharacterized membrane protein